MIAQAAVTVLFALLALAAVAGALAVVNARRLLRAAVSLMGVLGASAGLYLLLGARFLAGVQVLVYIGGIVVLIVFAVMLTSATDLQEDRPSGRRRLAGAAASIAFLAATTAVLATGSFGPPAAGRVPVDDTQTIGRQLLDPGPSGYLLPFEIVSLLLLGALIGGIVVARKLPPPGQPFTSGGDHPGEVRTRRARRQRPSDQEAAG